MNINDFAPGPALYLRVRAGFVAKGTSLNHWCRERGVKATNAKAALSGAWNGPAGRKLREDLVVAAGVAHRSQLAS